MKNIHYIIWLVILFGCSSKEIQTNILPSNDDALKQKKALKIINAIPKKNLVLFLETRKFNSFSYLEPVIEPINDLSFSKYAEGDDTIILYFPDTILKFIPVRSVDYLGEPMERMGFYVGKNPVGSMEIITDEGKSGYPYSLYIDWENLNLPKNASWFYLKPIGEGYNLLIIDYESSK